MISILSLFCSQCSSLKRRWEDLFILVLYSLDEAKTELLFHLSQMVPRFEVLLRESIFCDFETKTFCQSHCIIYIELLRLGRGLLVLEHNPHKFIILCRKDVQFVLFMMSVSCTILNDSYLCWAILFWKHFNWRHPFEFNIINL